MMVVRKVVLRADRERKLANKPGCSGSLRVGMHFTPKSRIRLPLGVIIHKMAYDISA